MDDMEAAPQMPPEGGQEPTQAGGYEICIKVSADGKLSVGVEKEAAMGEPPMPGQPGMEMEAEAMAYMPAQNVKEALTMALEIYRGDGQMPDDSGQAEFDSGYTNRMPA